MSRPMISAGSQQSRSGYPPPGTPAQPRLHAKRGRHRSLEIEGATQ